MSHLRLVYSRKEGHTASDGVPEQELAQGMLFPTPKKGLLAFVSLPDITDEEFKRVLDSTSPTLVLELRPVPRFDIGRMSRQLAFQWFREHGSRYVELTPADGRTLQWEYVLASVRQIVSALKAEDSSIMFLVNARFLTKVHVREIIWSLPREDDEPWSVFELPAGGCADLKATPE